MSSPSPVLPFGTFYGQVDQRRHGAGVEVALMNVDPHRVVERHSHEEAHFVFVLDGLYVSSAIGADAISRGPALVFNPPGTTHRDRFEARERVMEGRFLTISIASDLFAAATSDGIALHSATALGDANAVATAASIARACVDGGDTSALNTESLAMSLLNAVVVARRIGSRLPPRWLSVAEELLRDACDSDVRIADLAAVVGVHPVHLARVFRHFNQCTPADFLRRRRVERAEVLLRSSARPLSEIAASCGFADQSHFSNCFRRVIGMTPGACRAGGATGNSGR